MVKKVRHWSSGHSHCVFQLIRWICTTLLARAHDAASDHDVNIVHAWHNYMETLLGFWFGNNCANTVVQLSFFEITWTKQCKKLSLNKLIDGLNDWNSRDKQCHTLEVVWKNISPETLLKLMQKSYCNLSSCHDSPRQQVHKMQILKIIELFRLWVSRLASDDFTTSVQVVIYLHNKYIIFTMQSYHRTKIIQQNVKTTLLQIN